MPITLLRAPVGAGKTRAIIEHINATYRADPLARVWVVLPTARQEFTLRQRLIDEGSGNAPLFNLELFNFYALYERVLLAARQPVYEVSGMSRMMVLRHVIGQAYADQPSGTYTPIAKTLGFAELVSRLIDELKSARITPDSFLEVATTPKDRELATLYARYQAALQRGGGAVPLADIEGLGWLALDVLEQRPDTVPRLGLLAVDGFDQLTTVQADLVRALAQRADQTVLSLTDMPERVGQRARKTYDLLTRPPNAVKPVSLPPRPFQSPTLEHLARNAFAEHPTRTPLAADDEALTFIEAADPFAESSEVMRRVKRLLLGGAPAESVMIVVRDWATYAPPLTRAATAFGVPVAMHHGQSLTDHPLGAFVESVLRLSEEDFPTPDLLEVLQSPYVRLADEHALDPVVLNAIAQQTHLMGGEQAWLSAIEAVAQHGLSPDDESESIVLSPDQRDDLQARLVTLFQAVRLPEAATLNDYVQRVEEWFGHDEQTDTAVPLAYTLGTFDALRHAADTSDAQHDRDALRALKDALRHLLNAHALVRWLSGSTEADVLTRQHFLSDLRAALNNASLREPSSRAGRVLITQTTDARGLPHDSVFIIGLSEGMFPAKTADDPLYLDAERELLTERLRRVTGGVVGLATRAERAGDEGIFYELIGLPRQRLVLSRPYLQNGGRWPASYLWRASVEPFASTYDQLPSARRVRVAPAALPLPQDAATLSELGASLLHADPANDDVRGFVAYLHAQHGAWLAHTRQTTLIEQQRQRSNAPTSPHTGDLRDTPYAAPLAQRYGDDYRWSVSALETASVSAYQFFAKRVLGLQEVEEVSDEVDIRSVGNAMHGIFNDLYTRFMQHGWSVSPEHAHAALALAEAELPALLDEAPHTCGFADSTEWALERINLHQRILGLIAADFSSENALTTAFNIPQPRLPLLREWAFDARIALPNAQVIYLRGRFDRVDVVKLGDGLGFVLIDYKSGKTPYDKKELTTGKKLQMPLYIRALEHLLKTGQLDAVLRAAKLPTDAAKLVVLGGLYWGVKGMFPSLATVKAEDTDLIDAALQRTATLIQRIREADFTPSALLPDEGKCDKTCAYSALCRGLCALNPQSH
jgi:ATP-dependent helicase/DNAse subunit B